MPELVGFQTIEILDPNGVTFDAVGVFGLDFNFYLNLAHHAVAVQIISRLWSFRHDSQNYLSISV